MITQQRKIASVNWKNPTTKEWSGAESYLHLHFTNDSVEEYMDKFKEKSAEDDPASDDYGFKFHRAVDLALASGLTLDQVNSMNNFMDMVVQKEIEKFREHKEISPILIIKPSDPFENVMIADGHHRVIAMCILNPDLKMKCIIVKE